MNQVDNGLYRLIALVVLLIALALLFPFERGSSALRQARLAEQQGDLKAAAQLYIKAGQIFFWDRVALQIKAAQVSAHAGNDLQVITLLSPLQKDGLLPYQAQVLLAKAYITTSQPDAAMSLRREWIEKGYSTEPIDISLLKIYTEQGRFEQTLPILRALVAKQPETAEWHYRLGLVLAVESPPEAVSHLQRAAQLDTSYQPRVIILLEQLTQPTPEAVLAYLYSGRGLAAIGEWKLAERAFQHAVEQHPNFAEAWAYLGLARFRLTLSPTTPLLQMQSFTEEEARPEDHQQERPGLAELRFALQLNPRSQVALAFLTLYWQELGETQLALQSARQALRLYPDDLNVRLQYAQVLAQSGDLEGGWEVLREWINKSLDPSAARKALVLYCVQYGYRLSESALPLAKALVEQSPHDADSLDLLGQVYLGLEEWTLAQQTFERALGLDSSYAPAILHLGVAHFAQGNTVLARSLFQKVIQLAPFSPSGEQAKRYLEVYLP